MSTAMFGPYRLDGLLGRGGMGEVYRAYDTVRQRTVALKLLAESLAGNEEFTARFRREARIAARLSDPHLVPIHDFGEIDGRLYIDMQLVTGEDLGSVIARDGALDPATAVSIVEQVAGALDTAHEDGLVHRDVKPSNIMLAAPRPGRPVFAYLGDFGIARAVTVHTGSALTASQATPGTLHYMSPERFAGRDIDHRADVYALACVLYEALVGVRPFRAEEPAALVSAHLYGDPPRPSERRGELAAFDAVIAHGMAKDPRARPATAGALAASARAALSGQATAAPTWPRTAVAAPAPPTPPGHHPAGYGPGAHPPTAFGGFPGPHDPPAGLAPPPAW
ncbi:MAG TPA: serine/threonine-protein kinase, partial [Pseudonocardia sp.]|nr:serine/threonine-protein kinase [Pseudonocardia sp.]